jgi:hypothetical protein
MMDEPPMNVLAIGGVLTGLQDVLVPKLVNVRIGRTEAVVEGHQGEEFSVLPLNVGCLLCWPPMSQ